MTSFSLQRPPMVALARELGLEVVSGGHDKANCRCPSPHHPDRNPSCSCFYGHNGEPRLHCHACGYSCSFAEYKAASTPGFNKQAGRRFVAKTALSLSASVTTLAAQSLAPDVMESCAIKVVEELVVELCPVRECRAVTDYLQRRGLSRHVDLAALPGGVARKELASIVRDYVGAEKWAASSLTAGDDFADPSYRLIIVHRRPDGSICGVTRRTLSDSSASKRYKTPPGTHLTWPFGASRVVAACAPETVIVEGALDSLAYEQLKGAANGVLGIPGANSWRDEWCHLLGQRVVVALDGDEAGQRGAARIVASIQTHRPEIEISREVPAHGKDWGEEVARV